jgi:protein O-mannosyl-transferase
LSSSATAPVLEKATTSIPPSHSLLSREKRSMVLCLSLVLVTLAFYNPVVHNGFTNMDDDGYVTDNTHVQAGLTWATVKWAFTSIDVANWHPVTWLSHAVDCQIFKLNPAGHHYVNVLFHATNVFLLFLLLQAATGLTWPSFTVAALFALHPVNVESVAWVAERKNVLSMLFFLLTIFAYQRYVRQISVKRYAAVAFLFALGLMAKPEVITLPFVLLLWDYWPLQRMFAGTPASDHPTVAQLPRSFGFLFLEKVPLLLLSAGSAVITMIAQREGNAVRLASSRVRFGNAAVAYARYLGKALWPTRLAALYPHMGRFLPVWQIVASSALLLLLTAFVLHGRRHRYLVVGWFWFLGTLVPVIGIVQVGVQAMADRYAYISFIGLFICVAWGIAELLRARKIAPVWAAVPAVLVLAAYGVLTHRQIGYWHDSETLWKHTLSVTDKNYFAHNALAYALAQNGKVEEAIVHFDAAESLHTYTALDMASVAAYKRAHGYMRPAIDEYLNALNVAEDSKIRSIVLSRLSSIYLQVGDLGRAKAACEYAIKENPKNGSALVACGLVSEREGDLGLAAARISSGMQVEPTSVGYLLLAQVQRRAGHLPDAEESATQAQRISRDIDRARKSAAEVLSNAGIPNN